MAWNEPGGGKDKDPWGNRGKQQGPPDLDELVRKIQDKFGGLFGGKKGAGASRGGGGSASFGIGILVLVALAAWVLSGIYIVDPAEQGVVLRFGKYQQSSGPGPHWHLPYPIETVYKVNVEQVSRTTPLKTQMLTKDQNLIRIQLTAQYRVSNAENYLFKVKDPDDTLNEATESALRDVVGSKDMDDILSVGGGREALVMETRKQIQAILDLYKTGLRVTKVNLESIQPPEEVQAAFEDAINAEEDEDRYKKQAEAYANGIIPKAQGDARRLEVQALAYKQQVVDKAQGDTSRFLQTLREYKKAPEITRKRLYIETMEAVLSNSSKVLIEMRKGSNIMYLPLDRFLRGGTGATAEVSRETAPPARNTAPRSDVSPLPRPIRPSPVRERGGR